MRKSPSKSSLSGSTSTVTVGTPSSSSTLSVDIKAEPVKSLPNIPDSATVLFAPMAHAVKAVFMERTPFAIDDAKDDEDESEDELGADDNDDQVMDEVHYRIFLI
jgi:TBC1 domain family member 8/9